MRFERSAPAFTCAKLEVYRVKSIWQYMSCCPVFPSIAQGSADVAGVRDAVGCGANKLNQRIHLHLFIQGGTKARDVELLRQPSLSNKCRLRYGYALM
jgi:hypothetical protein